jgi:hypothetical protein
MLIALLTVVLLGGGGTPFFPKETKVAIREVVVDPMRQKAVLGTIKDVEGFRKKPNKDGQKARKELARLESDHSAEAEEIRAAYEVIVDYRREVSEAYTDAIFEMRANMTSEEWLAVFGSDS